MSIDVRQALNITMFDVGQAECFLLEKGQLKVLVDCGSASQGKNLVKSIKKRNIEKIDYVFITHPHEDHIGSADVVIDTFNVENVYMTEYPATSKTYKDVITAINNAAIAPHYVTESINFEFGDAIIDIYPPFDINTDNVNDSSIMV